MAIRQAFSRKRDKIPEPQKPPLNNVIDIVGYERSSETEDAAQNIWNTSMSFSPPTDEIPDAMRKSSEADRNTSSNNKVEFDSKYLTSPGAGMAANDVRKDGGDEEGPHTGKRRSMPENPSPLDPALLDQAIVGSSKESSNLPKNNGIQRNQHSDESRIIATRELEATRIEAAPLSETTQYPVITDRASTRTNKPPLKPRFPPSFHLPRGTKKVNFAPHAALSENQNCPKVLILGISGAGKSTLLQSMTIYCGGTYDITDRFVYRDIIYSNIIDDIAEIIRIIRTRDIHLDSEDNERHLRRLIQHTRLQPISKGIAEDVALAIQALWDDSNVQACIQTSKKHRFNNSYD